jgi:8-oxo-dGTP pyrophosphatase MutT (NUDIX family)
VDINDLTPQEIASRLAAQPVKELDNPYPPSILKGSIQPAAVLIPFLRHEGAWHLLFIRRTQVLGDPHSGQVAYPGGSRDPSDSSVEEAAIREACEELGLTPEVVKILGKLNPLVTITNYLVTPVVGTIPWPYPLNPTPEEVSRVFTIPLSWLNDITNHETLDRELQNKTRISVTYFREYDSEILWGVSARITLELLETVKC